MSESNQFEMPATSPTPETPPTSSPSTAPVAMVVAPLPPQRPASSQQALWRARGLAARGAPLSLAAAGTRLGGGAAPPAAAGGGGPVADSPRPLPVAPP